MFAANAAYSAEEVAAHGGMKFSATLSGADEAPGPGATDGRGTATVTVNPGQKQICYTLDVSGIGAANAAHIHVGEKGKSGGVKVPLETPGADGKSKGCASVDDQLMKDIMDNPAGYYVNVHTAAFPNGAVRGQLTKGKPAG
jgi:hypothetical protein